MSVVRRLRRWPATSPSALVVATHGLAMTLWLTARTGLPAPDAFWQDGP